MARAERSSDLRAAALADPITLEVIRARLQSIAREMSSAIVKTAVSAVISEARDFSCTLFDAAGSLVAGAATVLFHFGVVARAAQTILEEYGGEIDPGDVFIANDPHHGGGLHPQDVILLKPIFADGRRIAWAGASGHMLDVGGMVPGSFAPSARECYQEALRIPPTKLFRGGALDRGLWRLVLNNVRMSEWVSMDLMSLVAGLNLADERIVALVPRYGEDVFVGALQVLQDLSERELRRRIAEIPAGEYAARGWTEYGDEFFEVRCTLRAGEELVFDYAGSAPQCPYFFNSRAHIVESELVIRVYQILTPDVPFTQGVLRAMRVEAPAGSIVDSRPPAPISAAHMHVGLLAMELGETCLKRALACGSSPRRARITSQGGTTGLGNTSWTARRPDGAAEAFLLMDGNGVGGGACAERDGINLTGSNYGGPGLVYPDVEIVEQTSPILVLYKRLRTDAGGAGRCRGGASIDEAFTPYGVERLEGTLFGMRRHLPVGGLFGGAPGGTTIFERSRSGDAVERLRRGEHLASRAALGEDALEMLPNNASGVTLRAGQIFAFGCAAGGGLGDPLDRDAAAVVLDVKRGLVSPAQAERVYGVVAAGGKPDRAATERRRAGIREARLARARRPPRAERGGEGRARGSLGATVAVVETAGGRVEARCAACDEPLSLAPATWKSGAAIAETPLGPATAAFFVAPVVPRRDPAVILRELFCPGCARVLESEVVLEGTPIEDDVRPAFYALRA